MRRIAHMDGLFTFSLSLSFSLSRHHLCVPVSFNVDWLFFPASLLISLCFSPSPYSLFVWRVFDWEGCPNVYFFLLVYMLHLMLADWLVWLTSGHVMRSWLAVCNLCMISSSDDFLILHRVQQMNLAAYVTLSFPLYSLLCPWFKILSFSGRFLYPMLNDIP